MNDFVQLYELPYMFALDAAGDMAALYQLRGVPTTLFIDPNGVITDMTLGVATEAWIGQQLSMIDG